MFVLDDVSYEQEMFNGIYLFFFFTLYAVSIMITGALTLQQVRERLADHADQHKQLLRRLSKIAVAHTLVFSLFLFWFMSSTLMPVALAVEVLSSVSDLVAFSTTYIVLFFDKNVHSALKDMIPIRIALGSVGDVHQSNNNNGITP